MEVLNEDLLDIRFPLFVSLKHKKVVVVGGGEITERRVKTLLDFKADITIISPEITEALEQFYKEGKIKWIQKPYEATCLEDAFIVLAATSCRNVNRQVGMDAHSRNILVSVADAKEECSFYFPALVRDKGFIAGVVSDCGDHKQLRRIVERMRAGRWDGERQTHEKEN